MTRAADTETKTRQQSLRFARVYVGSAARPEREMSLFISIFDFRRADALRPAWTVFGSFHGCMNGMRDD